MNEIFGSAKRSFIFPASLPLCFDYYAEVSRSFSNLPHISVEQDGWANHYRLLYTATESGLYQVKVYCDIKQTIFAYSNKPV